MLCRSAEPSNRQAAGADGALRLDLSSFHALFKFPLRESRSRSCLQTPARSLGPSPSPQCQRSRSQWVPTQRSPRQMGASRGMVVPFPARAVPLLLAGGTAPGALCCVVPSMRAKDDCLLGNNRMPGSLPAFSSMCAVSDNPRSFFTLHLSPPDSLQNSCSLLLGAHVVGQSIFPSSRYTRAKVHLFWG